MLMPTPDVAAYYPLTGDYKDYSRWGNVDLTPVGCSFVETAPGGPVAPFFDGTDDYLSAGTFPSRVPVGDASRTICLWVQSHRTPSTTPGSFFSYGTNAGSQAVVLYEDTHLADRTVSLWNGGVAGALNNQHNLVRYEWTHLAVTHALGGSGFDIYRNGKRTQTLLSGGEATGSTAFILGRSLTATNYHMGFLRDFVVFDRVLNASGINSVMLGENPL